MTFSNACCSHIGFLSNVSVTIPFQWNVLSAISVSKVFSWDVGEGPLYWYMIESHPCTDVGCCSNVSICGNMDFIEIQTIMATSVKHLCTRLREQRFNKKIFRLRKWTRPALECDVKKDEEQGINHCCNRLISVDLCDCECAGYLLGTPSTCSVTPLVNKALVWYTEYLHLDVPFVNVGDQVVRGQLLAYLVYPVEFGPHLHWGVGDGQGGGIIGQTLDIDDVFNWPAYGERIPSAPASTPSFTDEEICYIRSTLQSPVNKDCCLWQQGFGSLGHTGLEYYAQDINCTPPEEDLGMPVYVASGGCDVDSEVVFSADIGVGWAVLVKHTKKVGGTAGTSSLFSFSFAPQQTIMACDFGLKKQEPQQVVTTGFAARSIQAIQPGASPIKVQGQLRPIPVILKLTHDLKGKLGDKVPAQVALTYSAVTRSWQYSRHFLSDGVQWSLTFNLTNEGETWALQANVGRSVGGKNRLTRLKAGVQKLPADKFLIEVAFDPAGSIRSNCVVHYKSISDELKLLGEPLTIKIGDK